MASVLHVGKVHAARVSPEKLTKNRFLKKLYFRLRSVITAVEWALEGESCGCLGDCKTLECVVVAQSQTLALC